MRQNVVPIEKHPTTEQLVAMWLDGLPLAVVPLWQVEHPPGTTSVWLNFAGVQPVVV